MKKKTLIICAVVIAIIAIFLNWFTLLQKIIVLVSRRCLEDKSCYLQSYCDSAEGGGCALGGYTVRWKDEKLGEKYVQITQSEAQTCLLKYIQDNKIKYSKLQHLDLSTLKVDPETNQLFTSEEERTNPPQDGLHNDFRNFDKKDTYAYYAEVGTEPSSKDKYNRAYGLTFKIGAQSCNVYPDMSVYKPF